VTIPPGPHLSDALVSSPVLQVGHTSYKEFTRNEEWNRKFSVWFDILFTKLHRTIARKQRLQRDRQANVVFQLTFFTLPCKLKGLCHEISTFTFYENTYFH
jgi:hypothetical protein